MLDSETKTTINHVYANLISAGPHCDHSSMQERVVNEVHKKRYKTKHICCIKNIIKIYKIQQQM